MQKKRSSLMMICLIVILWATIVIGATYAQFTDNVEANGNVVATGNLKVKMEWADSYTGDSTTWTDAEKGAIFSGGHWEPNYTDVKYIRVTNAGNLAFRYRLSILPTLSEANPGYKLGEVIEAYVDVVGEGYKAPTGYKDFEGRKPSGTVASMIASDTGAYYGELLQPEQSIVLAVVLHMDHEAGNEYMGLSVGDGFALQLYATQAPFEKDSFDDQYDAEATLPENPFAGGSASGSVTVSNGVTTAAVTLKGGEVEAYVPAGVKVKDGVDQLTLTVTVLDESPSNIRAGENESLLAVDVHVDGLAADNEVPLQITLKEALTEGLNVGNTTLYHVENGKKVAMTQVMSAAELTAHNQYYYNPVDGTLVLNMATFSEVAAVSEDDAAWKGNYDYSWYTNAVATLSDETTVDYTIANADQLAAFGKIVGGMDGQTQDSFTGKTVKLISDVNLGDKDNANTSLIFYPIGYYYTDDKTTGDYYSTVKPFEGIFDGNGHTIANFYQNTWEIKGDYDGNYYSDAMGLFGYVVNGTVKNLTVDNFSSDGEFTPTGVIAAYAAGDATFENIAITNCNPRVYNTGNGGIIGIAGSTSAANDDHITLKNITVDNSNKISALWGSWDVACGGLVGMYRGNVDGSGNATGDTISFENCHVAAQIDVNNDVCANYQYYAYRYAGMIIGSVRHNTTNADGKTIPNMTGISASECTVNFGDWNDYYYCELVANSLASYTHDHQMSRLTQIQNIDGTIITYLDGTTGTVPTSGAANYVIVDTKDDGSFNHSSDNATCYHFVDGAVWNHEDAGTETVNGVEVPKEDKQHIYLEFDQLFTGYGWGVNSVGLDRWQGITTMGITGDGQEKSVEKFESKFTGDFLYRVGNQNAVSVGSLFAAKKGAEISGSGVWVTIDKVDENMNVSGTFTANTSDWTQGTIQFSGTGVVKVTIQDYEYCKPTTLLLEVVDAKNVTTAASATANNVVLLNDCGFSSLTVSNGYALYGNGFTMTCSSDSVALDMGSGFVTLNNGTLDNVQIVCPNFDYAALYKSNLTSSDNRSATTNGTTRYYNAKSGVMASGNSQIFNSRISGGRAAVNVSGGNLVIDNSRIELGAVASILVGSANRLTLRDVTLVQKPTVSTHDSSKTLLGFSVLCICNSEGNAAPITLEGNLVQYAWIDEDDAQYVPSAGQSIVNTALGETDYLHDLDGDGVNESLNLGFAYMPESTSSSVNITSITDNRTDKDEIPYDFVEVSSTYVYSYKNSNGTADSFKTVTGYVSEKYSDIVSVNYTDTTDGLTTDRTYGTDGWVYELYVDLDKATGYELDFSKLSMSVNGVNVTDYKVNGSTKPDSTVAVTAGGTTYTLTATVNGTTHNATFKVTGTETSKESPSLLAEDYETALLVGEAGNALTPDTWHGAAPALEGIQIKYWSVAESKYKTITLSDYTPSTAGKQNDANNTWTYSPDNGDFTLTLTGGQVHSNNKVNAMPVVFAGKLYFVAAGSNGLVNYGNSKRTIPVTYSFKDNNGGTELTFDHTWEITCADNDTAYDYSDFCNGTSSTFTIDSSHGDTSCVTPDTLVTLADGSKKEIQYVTYDDQLLVWDFYKGGYAVATACTIVDHGEALNTVISLIFEDGTVVKAVNCHAFMDATENEFVYITGDNVTDYIGHEFVKHDADGYTTVELVDCKVSNEVSGSYTLVANEHYNFITENMFSATLRPEDIGAFQYFDIGENMTYINVEEDIAKYGVFTYEEFADRISRAAFDGFNVQYMKIAIGKGLVTEEAFQNLIDTMTVYTK